jgi:hypothetical protein
MLRVAEFRHYFFDSPLGFGVRSSFSIASSIGFGCGRLYATSADLGWHPYRASPMRIRMQKGKRSLMFTKRSLMFIKLKAKFSNRRQKCIHNDALINVAAQHFLLLMPYESMKKVILLVENYLL